MQLVEFFCQRVQSDKPAYISLEYRNSELKYFLNNAPAAPHRRRTTAPDRRQRQQTAPQPTAAPNRRTPTPCITRAEPVNAVTPAATPSAPPSAPFTPGAPAESMADNTRAKRKRKAVDKSPPTSTPEVVRAGQGPSQQQEVLQISHLEIPDRDADTDTDDCSDSGARVDECDEDEENPPIECAFLSNNIYNVLNGQTTPPPTVANADVTPPTTVATTENDAPTLTHLTICKRCTGIHKRWDYTGEVIELNPEPGCMCCWEWECDGMYSVNKNKK